ncbi:DUF134 domain-containing protein [Pseudovibrio sp. Tun.PSC04-5.I4]|uniref:DUF134 domain-containing protein n=1 Tax=Pseudovibrio sp. Tun.PSC04-5.I4 TaxID=1798213 RepID=UPI0008827A9E|nr:DUF134 domain-containing protein [Pseudovibrio sp. Tun.PSC04-5.I4]SDR19205.1 Predicted DNA-binding protein, UPF0251 family [Pseudovibrio sp. Tun.PSC04-5.I4]
MPRPRKLRMIQGSTSGVRFFKPQGVPLRKLKAAVLTEDGMEALRLADAEGLEHAAAADLMGISRPTFSRLVAHARTTVATALCEGMALKIEGGAVEMAAACAPEAELSGEDCQRMRRRRGFCGRAGVISEDVVVPPAESRVDEAG